MSGREPGPAGRQRKSDGRPQQLHAARRGWPLTGLFTADFVAPVALTCVYFFAFAADQYASDAQFLVRGAFMSQVALQVPGLSFARSSDETQIVASYMRSHDLPDALQRQTDLKEMYRRPGCAVRRAQAGDLAGQ